MWYDYFFEIDDETIGLIQCEGYMNAYVRDGGKFIGRIAGSLKDYKNGEDGAKFDLSNVDDEKLASNLVAEY